MFLSLSFSHSLCFNMKKNEMTTKPNQNPKLNILNATTIFIINSSQKKFWIYSWFSGFDHYHHLILIWANQKSQKTKKNQKPKNQNQKKRQTRNQEKKSNKLFTIIIFWSKKKKWIFLFLLTQSMYVCMHVLHKQINLNTHTHTHRQRN